MSRRDAYVFPGGGTQSRQRLASFIEKWPEAAAVVDAAPAVDYDPSSSEVTVTAESEVVEMNCSVVGTGAAVAEAVERRFDARPFAVAGHSLGHVTALAAAGMVTPAEAIEFAIARGRAMTDAATAHGRPGKMVAVIGPALNDIERAVDPVDHAVVGAYNAPNQAVISGESAAVDEVIETLDSRSDRMLSRRLDVAIASHSPIMAPSVDRITRELERTLTDTAEATIVSDMSGECYTSPETAVAELGRQPTSPVRWVRVVESLVALDVDRIVEFPPAGVLSKLVSRIDPDVRTVQIDAPEDARALFDDDE